MVRPQIVIITAQCSKGMLAYEAFSQAGLRTWYI